MTTPATRSVVTDDTDIPRLVDENGLVKLFANRTRSRILVTLLYADEPLTVAEIAEGAGIYRSAVFEALDPLAEFEIFETGERDGERTYGLVEDDDLVAAVRSVARLATERIHPE
jgi:DNA-binding transcriptional regulator GbsR (MarR family)